MFQFPTFAFLFRNILADGFPHSEISGSTAVCAYPKLFAAYHVLLRLQMPRHPPYTLITFLLFLGLLFVCLRRQTLLLDADD